MQVIREDVLTALRVALVGTSKKELLEQSNCLVFTGKTMVTFNGEIATGVVSPVPDVKGAVVADDLVDLLSKFPDEKVDVSVKDDELRVRGKRREAGITLQAEVHLPYRSVPRPKRWSALPAALVGTLLQAARVCGRDETRPRTTEVHIAPGLVEACDDFRMFRATMDTGFDGDQLVPAASLEAVGSISFTRGATDDGWFHLRTKAKHRVSIRCSAGEYPDLKPLLRFKETTKVQLPGNLPDILARASVMQEGGADAQVSVTIDKGKLVMKSRKDGGWFREQRAVQYSGAKLAFKVNPKFLEEILSKTRTVRIGDGRMKIGAKGVVFIVCLEA